MYLKMSPRSRRLAVVLGDSTGNIDMYRSYSCLDVDIVDDSLIIARGVITQCFLLL